MSPSTHAVTEDFVADSTLYGSVLDAGDSTVLRTALLPILTSADIPLGASDIEIISIVVQTYPDLDPQKRRVVQRALASVGMESVCSALTGAQPVAEKAISCPVMRQSISSPCGLSKCRYHIKRPVHLNCLLAVSGHSDMGLAKISEVMGKSHPETTALRKAALSKIRRHTVPVTRDGDGEKLRTEFVFLVTAKACCVCEKGIFREAYHVHESGIAFCSSTCHKERDINHILAELRFGVSFSSLIEWAISSYSSVASAADALGMPKSVVKSAIESQSSISSES